MSEEFLKASISPASKQKKAPNAGDQNKKCGRSFFVADMLVPPTTLYELQQHSGAQPQLTELLSSSRARALISRQLHALHVSPDDAMEEKQLKAACDFIKKNYPDLPLVVSLCIFSFPVVNIYIVIILKTLFLSLSSHNCPTLTFFYILK